MGPKQRKSLSSASTLSYANSPWKSLTRVELYEVLDSCDIPVSSEKLLKGEVIEILEKNLNEAECRKWLEHYNKPLPPSSYILNDDKNTDFLEESPKNKKIAKGRQSVPAYIAVANLNSDTIFSNSPQNSRNTNSRARTRNSISKIHCSESPNDDYLIADKQSSRGSNSEKRPNSPKYKGLSEKIEFSESNNEKELDKATCKPGFYDISNINLKNVFKMAVIIFCVITALAVYNHFKIFISDPRFCDTNYLSGEKTKGNTCVACPANGYCKNGILTCNQQYKKAIKYIKNKWQVLCVYDNEAFELSEEMLSYISRRLRRMKGNRSCNTDNLLSFVRKDKNDKNENLFDISASLSELEINNLIHLSFSYIESNVIDNALSIMWNSIKNGNSLSKYRLALRNISDLELGIEDSIGEANRIGRRASTLYVEAIDPEMSLMCSAKITIRRWIMILSLIVGTVSPLYIFFLRKRRKIIVMRKIKEIILRENRKDTVSGLFIGPDANTISRILNKELPQYKGVLPEEVVTKYCDELEKNDKSIQKTVFSNSKVPFYWVSN